MLETILLVVLVLWLLGFLGPMVMPAIPHVGNGIHLLLVVIIVLVVVRLLRGGL